MKTTKQNNFSFSKRSCIPVHTSNGKKYFSELEVYSSLIPEKYTDVFAYKWQRGAKDIGINHE